MTSQAPKLFDEINLSQNNYPKLIAACNGTEYFLVSLIPIFIIEMVGRRKLMLIGVRHPFLRPKKEKEKKRKR